MKLSTDARVMILAVFLGGGRLHYANLKSRPSQRAKEALTELESCDLVTVTTTGDAVTYRATNRLTNLNPEEVAKGSDPMTFLLKNGSFDMRQAID